MSRSEMGCASSAHPLPVERHACWESDALLYGLPLEDFGHSPAAHSGQQSTGLGDGKGDMAQPGCMHG